MTLKKITDLTTSETNILTKGIDLFLCPIFLRNHLIKL